MADVKSRSERIEALLGRGLPIVFGIAGMVMLAALPLMSWHPVGILVAFGVPMSALVYFFFYNMLGSKTRL